MGERRLVVGRIVKPHGIRGELVVEAHTDNPDRFVPGAPLGVGSLEDWRVWTVRTSRLHQGRVLVTFDEVGDRTAAEGLRGALLSVPEEEAMPPPEGAWYPHQIQGLAVVDEAGERLGIISDVLEGVANDVWELDDGRKKVLLPAVRDVIVSVDLEAGCVVIRLIPGLLE